MTLKHAILFGLTGFLTACGSAPEVLVGPKGDTGAQGPTGPQGVNGSEGMTIASGFSCSKSSNGYSFRFTGVKFSTGDAWSNCSISGSSFETSNSTLYKSSQNGATTYGCLLTWDLDASTSGFWFFTGTNGTRQTIYTDSGSASNGTVVSFSSSDCSSY